MTNPFDRPRLRVNNPADLLALVPYALGFHPADSLVVVTVRDEQFLQAARIDLPTTGEWSPELWMAIRHVTNVVGRHHATGAALIGYGTVDQVRDAVRDAIDVLTGASIPVVEILRVHNGRYFRLTCRDPRCCPPQGVPFDPTTSVIAAQATAAGLVALPNRDAVAATLAPVTGPARDRMTAATATATEFVRALAETVPPPVSDREPPLHPAVRAVARTHLDQVRDRYQAGKPVTDRQAALATVLLNLAGVRAAIARRTTGVPWQVDMWTDLVRRAEPHLVAGPAVLLTLSALQAGDGTLAGLAVQRALRSDPTDRLAHLLAQAVTAGIDPDTVTGLLTG